MKSLIDHQSTTEILDLLDSFLKAWNDKDLEGFISNFQQES